MTAIVYQVTSAWTNRISKNIKSLKLSNPTQRLLQTSVCVASYTLPVYFAPNDLKILPNVGSLLNAPYKERLQQEFLIYILALTVNLTHVLVCDFEDVVHKCVSFLKH